MATSMTHSPSLNHTLIQNDNLVVSVTLMFALSLITLPSKNRISDSTIIITFFYLLIKNTKV